MRIEKIDKLPENVSTYKWGRMQKVVKDFIDSGVEYAELKDWTHCSERSCCNAFNKAARTMRISARATCHDGRVYLIKE